jgi:predicted NBD/HSP70 family sugar kinase
VGGDPSSLDNPSLARAFRERDPWAVHVIGLVAEPLARSLAGMHLDWAIERFVLIGGFAFALGEEYRAELARRAQRAGWRIGRRWESMIELGFDDDLSGLIGAARYAVLYHESGAR